MQKFLADETNFLPAHDRHDRHETFVYLVEDSRAQWRIRNDGYDNEQVAR